MRKKKEEAPQGFDAIISVNGLLGTSEEGDEIELNTTGTYSYSPGNIYFEYMETELTGMSGTKTSFSVTPQAVTITREGQVGMQMLFEEGKKHYFVYNTPYGSVTMGLGTRDIENRLMENGGRLRINYTLDMFDMASRNNVTVDIRKQQQERKQ